MKNISVSALLALLTALSLVTACATLPENVGRKETFAYPGTAETCLGRKISEQEASHPGESGFHLLSKGLDAFVARGVSASFDRYWNSELACPASVLTGEPPTPEEIARKRQQLEEFVAAQADSVYLKALRNSTLADKIRKNQVGYSWGHAVVVFDREQVFIGSLNLDPRAVIHNTEIGVVLTSPEIAQGMGAWFDENIGKLAFRLELKRDEGGSEILLWHGLVDGTPQTFDADPYTGFWKRLGIGFLGILPIESQL